MVLAPFSPKAKSFFTSDPRNDRFFTLLEGSVRSGKTWAMLVKILTLNRYKVGGQRVLVGYSKSSLYTNVLSDLFSFVGTKNYTYSTQTGKLVLYGVEWKVIGVSNEGSEKAIRGMTAGIMVWDEVTLAPKNVFDMAMSRLSPTGARFYGTTNPDTPFHYLVTEYLENPDFKHNVARVKMTLEDNYSLDEETRKRYRTMYKGVFYQRMIQGLWVAAEGAVYGSVWTDSVLFDDATAPPGLRVRGGHQRRVIACDYGTANATVFLDIYDDGITSWVWQEYYWDSRKEMAQKTDSQYADDLDKFCGGPLSGVEVILDPSAASFAAELRSRGYIVIDANNDVLDGIRVTSTLLGNRTLRFNRERCPRTIIEMSNYSWDDKAMQRTGEEKPLKKNDHGPDGIRYYGKTAMPEWRLQIAA